MTLDVFAAVLLAILSYLGWRTGALGQLLRIVGAVLVLLFGRVAAEFVREVLFGSSKIAEPAIEVTSYFLGATLLYVAVVLVGWFVIRTMRAATPTLATADRAGGAALGAVKAAVLIYVMIAGAVLLTAAHTKQDPDDRLHFRDGQLTRLAQEYDVFSPWQMPELDSLHRFMRAGLAAREKGVEHLLRDHADIADLLRQKSVRDVLDDEALEPALQDGKSALTLADERIRALLNDKEFVQALEKINLDEFEAIVAQAGAKAAPEAVVAPTPDAGTVD